MYVLAEIPQAAYKTIPKTAHGLCLSLFDGHLNVLQGIRHPSTCELGPNYLPVRGMLPVAHVYMYKCVCDMCKVYIYIHTDVHVNTYIHNILVCVHTQRGTHSFLSLSPASWLLSARLPSNSPRGSKASNNEYLAQTMAIIPYMEVSQNQGP